MRVAKSLYFVGILFITLIGCKKQIRTEPGDLLDTSVFSGTASFTYSEYAPLFSKPLEVFYHIPDGALKTSPILIAFHGAGRDGAYSRNTLIDKADKLKFIVVVPQFASTYYPGGDRYNLGNVFDDGDNPSAATLNNESEWTFSIVEPLFDYFTEQTQSVVSAYDVFGHSAGGQFAHRLLLLKPAGRYDRIMAAAPGWYTMPDTSVDFPYGLDKSPVDVSDLPDIFSRNLTVMVGELDNNPNSAALRHTPEADAQGLNRYDRAHYFFNQSGQIANGMGASFSWKLRVVPNVAHDFAGNAEYAADLLYK